MIEGKYVLWKIVEDAKNIVHLRNVFAGKKIIIEQF